MIDTDDLDNMSRRDLVGLLEAYNELLAEVKRLREAFVIAVRHVGYHHSQDDLWYALRERGMDDLYDDDEDFGEWEE